MQLAREGEMGVFEAVKLVFIMFMFLTLTLTKTCGAFASESPTLAVPMSLEEPAEMVIPLNETESEVKCKIKEIRGTVEVKKAGSEEWIPATKDMEISEGDKISTGFRSKCSLIFGDDTEFMVKSLTQMTVNRFTKEGDTIEGRIYLRIGDIRLKVKEDQPVKTDLKVTTPNPTCSVRGTIFGVIVEIDNTTIVEAFDGEVMVNDTVTNDWTIIEGYGNGTGYRAIVDETGMSVELETDFDMSHDGDWDFYWWLPAGGYMGDLRRPTHL